MLHKMWSQNLKFSRATLNHDAPQVFTRCFWQKKERVTVPWLLYRVFLAVYSFVTWYLSFIHFGREVVQDKYFIYLTNWSYLLLTVQLLVAAFIVVFRFIKERRGGTLDDSIDTHLPSHYKLYWVLNSVSAPSAIMVTIIFWVAVFDPKLHPVDVINITTHLVNSLLTLFDFILAGHPYRLLHFHWTFGYVVIYTLFTVVYYHCGGTDVRNEPYIYKILDWRMPSQAIVTCVGVLIFMLVVHIAFWGLHRFKKWSRGRCYAARVAEYKGEENLGMDHKPNKSIV